MPCICFASLSVLHLLILARCAFLLALLRIHCIIASGYLNTKQNKKKVYTQQLFDTISIQPLLQRKRKDGWACILKFCIPKCIHIVCITKE